MKFRIQHYYGGSPPAHEAVKISERTEKLAPQYEIEIDDLQAWIETHEGNVIVSPPGCRPYDQGWFIWVTDASDKFSQK